MNEISKYFKKPQPVNQEPKSYVQVLARQPNSTNIARKTLKIKETFSNFQNKKIEIVQKIISGQDKLKPKISMTTKGLFCKQVIVPIKDNDVNNFIKDLSMHVININQETFLWCKFELMLGWEQEQHLEQVYRKGQDWQVLWEHNQMLKNIKFYIMADYIHIDSKHIIITTNNIASLSDLQAVKKYVKSASNIDAD